MTWIYLILAGLFEVFWATTMKLSQGFTQLGWSIATIVGQISSFVGLLIAIKNLPIGIVYPVWTRIGAVGSVIVSMTLFHDQMSMLTWLFVILLIVAIIGIKVTSSH